MPSITCLCCKEQKRMKGDKFYFVDNIPNLLIVINNLRQTYNTKKRKLVKVSNIPPNSKVCQTYYKLSKKPCVSSPPPDQNKPDLSIYLFIKRESIAIVDVCLTAKILKI